MPRSLTLRGLMPGIVLAGLLSASALLSTACTRNASDNPAPSANLASSVPPSDHTAYRYLYAVYCNGTVDRLDLVQRAKAGSFQLSGRSGKPAAVAALPLPGVRPDGCLARPVATGDAKDQGSGVVHIVASGRLDPDTGGRKPYQLLTFSLPEWTLQHARDLGSFDAPPRLAWASNDTLTVQSQHSDPGAEMVARIQGYAGAASLGWTNAMEWSAGNVLLVYALPDQAGTGAALASHADARVVRFTALRSGGNDVPPDLHLAPGGRFVMAALRRSVPLGQGIHKVEATGELRLYGADGRLIGMSDQTKLAGSVLELSQSGKLDLDAPRTDNDWFNVALTPGGLAVFTDRRGNYQFIDLGHRFGTDPVMDPSLDDADGARPGLVYATQ